MADLDAELLALAGGDSSGEESMPSPPRKKSPSPHRSTKLSRDSPPLDMARKGIAKTTKKPRRRRNYSDDEDEVSSLSQRSDSASMSQSDSEAEFAPAEDRPMFPYEKLYYDSADKARIQAKPEIEREEILAQRSEQVERHEQDLTLRRLVAARAKEEAKNAAKNKRKASAADPEDNQRKSSRQRTKLGGGRAGEASSAIEAYKLQRAEKTLRDEQRKKNAAARVASPIDDYSDVDAEGESDNDYDDRRYKRRSPTPPKDDPVAELSDIQRVRIGRDNFAQVCYTPGFKETISGCYARVCLGPGRRENVNEYRLCSIKTIQKGRPYAMTGANNRQFLVDDYIVAVHGKAERPWSFLECSMSRFTDDEWRRYRLTMANEDCKMPTVGVINRKLEQINKLINHRFTDAEITARIKAQNSLMDLVNRANEKEELKEKISVALANGTDEQVAELEEKLANLVPVKLAMNTSLAKADSGFVNKEQERLAELNRRNQRLNAENVRKAQLAEMRARKTKKHLAPGVDELFEGGSDISRTGTPVNGLSTPKLGASLSRAGTPNPVSLATGTPRSSTPVPSGLKPLEKRKGLPVIRKSALDDEILASMDLGIDIDI